MRTALNRFLTNELPLLLPLPARSAPKTNELYQWIYVRARLTVYTCTLVNFDVSTFVFVCARGPLCERTFTRAIIRLVILYFQRRVMLRRISAETTRCT